MKSLKAFIGFFVLAISSVTQASDFSCPVNPAVNNYTCSGTVRVTNLAELNAYKTNLGIVGTSTVAKSLWIDFNPSFTADFSLATPCSIRTSLNVQMSSTANVCLNAKKSLLLEDGFNFNGKNLNLEGSEDVAVNSNSNITAQNIQLLSIGNAAINQAFIRDGAQIQAANLKIESLNKGFIGRNSNVVLTGNLGIYSHGDEEASIREGARVEAHKVDVSSTMITTIANISTIIASEVNLNGQQGCKISKGAVITADDRLGNCFLASLTSEKFSIDKNHGTFPLTVNFNASTIAEAKGYIWDFGDGAPVRTLEPTISHTYATAGTFTAALNYASQPNYKVLKSAGFVLIKTKPEAIHANLECLVNHMLVSCNGLGSYDSESQPLTYTFDFGDGTIETSGLGMSSHSYATAGTYHVTLTVTNLSGSVASTSQVVQPLLAINLLPTPVLNCVSLKPNTLDCGASGSADSDGTIVSYRYEWGDQNVDTHASSEVISHVFSSPGQHSVKLIVTDEDGGVSELVKTFAVKENTLPTVAFNCEPNYQPKKIKCSSTSKDLDFGDHITQYRWSIGESVAVETVGASFDTSVLSSGVYPVKLEVVDAFGGVAHLVKNFTITDSLAPAISFQYPTNKTFDSGTDQDFYIQITDNESIDFSTVNLFINDAKVSSSKYSIDTANNKIQVHLAAPSLMNLGNNLIVASVRDSSGNTNSASVIYKLSDLIAPMIAVEPASGTHFNTQTGQIVYTLSNADDVDWNTFSLKLDDEELAKDLYKVEGNKVIIDISSGKVLAEEDNNFKISISDASGNQATLNSTFYLEISPLRFDFLPNSLTKFDLPNNPISIYVINDENEFNWNSLKVYWSGNLLSASQYSVNTSEKKISVPLTMTSEGGVIKVEMLDSSQRLIKAEGMYFLRDTTPPVINFSVSEGSQFSNTITPDISFDIVDQSQIDYGVLKVILNGKQLPKARYIVNSLTNKVTLKLDNSYKARVGQNTLEVVAVDVENNKSEAALNFSTIDTLPPMVAFSPVPGSSFHSNVVSLTASLSDDSLINWSTFKVSVNNVPAPLLNYYIDNNAVFLNLNEDYSFELGANTVSIEVEDIWGNLLVSHVSYNLLEQRPIQVAFSPDRNSHFKKSNPVLNTIFNFPTNVKWETVAYKLNNISLPSTVFSKINNNTVSVTLGGDYILKQGLNILVLEYDDAENTHLLESVPFFLDDIYAPVIAITPGSGSILLTQDLNFDFNIVDAGEIDTNSLRVDLNGVQVKDSYYSFNDSTSGSGHLKMNPGLNTVKLSVKDKKGNLGTVQASYTFGYKAGPTFKFNPGNWSEFQGGVDQSFVIEITDPIGINKDDTVVKLNGVVVPASKFSWSMLQNNLTVTLDSSVHFNPGTNTVIVSAKDTAGHMSSQSVNYKFIDNVAPLILFLPESGTSFSDINNPEIKIQLNDLSAIDFNKLEIWLNSVKLNSVDYVIDQVTKEVRVNFNDKKLKTGENSLEVKAYDIFSNLKVATASYQLVDSLPPVATFAPVSGTNFNNINQSVKISIADLSDLNWSTLDLKLNGTTISSSSVIKDGKELNIIFGNETLFQVGANAITMSVADISGNVLNANAQYSLEDIFPTTFTFMPANGSQLQSLTTPVTITMSDDSELNYSSLSLLLNGMNIPASQYTRAGNVISLNLNNNYSLRKGLNRVEISIKDSKNNIGKSSVSYMVTPTSSDVTGPILSITPVSGSVIAQPTIEIQASDVSGVDFTRVKVMLNDHAVPSTNLAINPAAGKITVTLDQITKLTAGRNIVSAFVIDNNNNMSGKSVFYDLVSQVQNDIAQPIITFTPAGGELVSSTPTITAFISDESGVDFSSLEVYLNDSLIDSRIITVDQVRSKVVLTFDSSYKLPPQDSNSIRIRVKDMKGNVGTTSVGFDKKSESVFLTVGLGDVTVNTFRSTCSILEGGYLRCWGYNITGQLGIGNTSTIGDNEPASSAPYVAIPEPIKQVSAGVWHVCAVTASGKLYCWGNSDYGQVGTGNSVGRPSPDFLTPQLVSIGGEVTQVTTGFVNTCALMKTGNVRCFGSGLYGALGAAGNTNIGDNELPSSTPEIVLNHKVVQVKAGYKFICALMDSGEVKCWGNNANGELGHGTQAYSGALPSAVPVVSLPAKAIQIDASLDNACALLETGKVYCWGLNSSGQVGLGLTQNIGDNETPGSTAGVNLPLPALKVSVGVEHACALLNNLTIRCWGKNWYGEIGDGSPLGTISTGQGSINVGGNVVDVDAGYYGTFVTLSNGTLRGFGASEVGQLGLGTTTVYGSVSPVTIPLIPIGGVVEMNESISASFTATPYYGPSPLQINFDASKTISFGGTITNYHWDFGDGTTYDSATSLASHLYNVNGVYKAVLTARDSNNKTGTFQRTITVGPANNPPFAFFTAASEYGVAPFAASFNGSGSFDINGTIASYSWNYGDGSTQITTTPTANHNYTNPGTYLVMMKVKDDSGDEAEAFPLAITVKEFNMSPFANFNCSTIGKRIDCNAYASADMDGSIVDYKWSFGDQGLVSGQNQYETSHLFTADGNYSVELTVTDNNGAMSTKTVVMTIDTIAPQILGNFADNILTDNPVYPLSLFVDDVNITQTTILLNGQLVAVSQDHVIDQTLNLSEGLNTVSVVSVDASGNRTARTIMSNLVLDTIAPTLASMNPIDGATVTKQTFTITGSYSEKLSALTINNEAIALGADGKSFSYNYNAYVEGEQELTFAASDIVGNSSSVVKHINVQSKILYAELISIQYLSATQLKVVGAIGAVKSLADISVSSGFLNSKSLKANADGSFETVLNYFTSAKITATDSESGRSESAQLNYNVDTTLAGTIKDTDGNPLPGVKVTLKNTDIASAITNASGIFTFSNPPTGDRELIIDGQNIPAAAIGPNKKFSIQELSVSIGVRQANILENPIYLAPLMYDGTETLIEAGVSTTVESEQVENAAIEIPGNVDVHFPEGNTLKAINMAEIAKDKTTVPVMKEVEPQTVIALEPSGLSFSEPVQLSLPNTNEFPAGMQLMIYSKNSKTGKWEIDGVAKVDEDGEKIVTQEGMGITHFSEVYAAPMGLKYSQINSQDKPGADTFNGAVSTSISFPGYKSLGTEIAPKLLYRSNWAHPTATVTNIFDIPDEVQMISSEGKRILAPVPGDLSYIKTWVVPESVDLTFIAGDYHSPKMTLTGIPNKAVVSLGMDFQNQNTGIMPFAANYEIHLKRMVIRSDVKGGGDFFNRKISVVDTPAEVFPETIPSELRGQLYIQNKSHSSVGRGWMIGGVQKIVNPGSSRLMLEEEDGSIATYVTNDKIQTVAKINEGFSGLNSSDADDVIVSGNNNSIYQLDTNTGMKSTILSAPEYSGYFNSNKLYSQYECTAWTKAFGKKICFAHSTRFYCQQKRSNYTLLPTRKYTIKSPDGSGYVLASENGVITFSGGTIGKLKEAPTSDTDLTFCSTSANCTNEIVTNTIPIVKCPGIPPGSGQVYDQGFDEGALNNARFNTIKSLSPSKVTNGFAVADYGNHRVRFVNLDTQKVSTIAGNGKTDDSGDGGSAVEASIYHPMGTVYDDNGNLYISTENGYIKKIDTSGKITKVAGNPNGVFYDQANALDMYLSRPYGMALDQEKNALFVADSGNNRILRIDLTTGVAKAVAGNGYCQNETPFGEVGGALNATLCNPEFITLDESKNLIIADTGHKLIRKVIFSDSASGNLKFDPIAEDGSSLTKNSNGSFIRTYRSGVKTTYDSAGKQISTIDRVGKTITNVYNSDGKIIEQVDPVGGKIFYAYEIFSGLLQKIHYSVDEREFTFTYDLNKNLSEVIYPDGTSKRFSYESDGLLLKEIDQKNFETSYTYNSWKRLSEVTRPDGKKIVINDSQSGNMANNYTGGVRGVFKTQGAEANQLVDGIKNAKGITTSFVQDETGYVSTIIDGEDRVTKVERDLRGRPTKIVRSDDSTVEFTYDQSTGDLLTKIDSSTGTVESFQYDIYGNILSRTDGLGRKISNEYDTKGQLAKTTNDTLGTSVFYSYDSNGLLLSQTDSLGQVTNAVYNARGNLIKSINSEGKETQFSYYQTGYVQKITDSNANKSIYEYDDMNRLLSVTTGENQKTNYGYQETGELVQIIDPQNKVTSFEYDILGQLIKKTGTRGEITELAYDANGNISKEITPKGDIKQFYYDNLDQLVRKLLPDDDYNYAYNVRGNVTSVRNLLSKVDFAYEHFDGGDVVSEVHSYGVENGADLPNTTLSYNYNELGEKIGMITPKGTFQYGRDAAGRLRSITNHKGEVFNVKYDFNQRLKEISTPATVTSFAFDKSGFNTQINHTRKSGALIEKFVYGRDEIGNRTSKTTTSGTSTYSYDKNYQLIQATSPSLPAENFTYDSIGNRSSDSVSTYIYDQSKQLIQEDYKYQYVFDINGNMTSKQEKGFSGNVENFDYNSENQMRTFRLYKNGQLAKEVSYTYDALGRRIEKEIIDHNDNSKSFTKRFAYDGSEILFELNENDTITQTYTHSTLRTDDPLAVANSAGTFYFVKDGLGSITDITDSDGFKVQHYDYSAFGKIISIKDGNGNDVTDAPPVDNFYTFTGREYDNESGLYYYRARYYDPNIGRFLTVDPAAGVLTLPITHINKYVYVGNSPINKVDPSGRSFFGEVGNFFGGKGGWGTDVLTAVAVVGVLYVSGATLTGATIAVASAAGGAALAAGAMAAFQDGNFGSNFSRNFHTNFRVSAVLLAGGAIAADISGGGVGLAGGNGLQGYVVSNQTLGVQGGLTIGSSAVLSGAAPSASIDAAGTKLGAHEFGHTLQFIGLSGASGLFGTGRTGAWGAYLGLGILGTTSGGTWWENSASSLGGGL